MPLPRDDVDTTTPKFLRAKYAVVGWVMPGAGSAMVMRRG
jgi:hypothetical protein